MTLNPAHIVAVADVSPDTLRQIIAHLEVSTDFDHLVYREAELDAVWSICGFILQNEPKPEAGRSIAKLHRIVQEAHDLVAASRPREAAALLTDFLSV